MKIINYNYGYNSAFNCSIHGKIIVSQEEWDGMIKYLFHPKVKSYYLYKNILKQDLQRWINTKKGRLYNIRVSATEKLIEKFGPGKGYKTGNYMFLVKRQP